MSRDDSSEGSEEKRNINDDEFHERNENGDDDDIDVTLASKEKSKMIAKSRRSKSMMTSLKPEKKIKKRQRNSKNTILELLKSSILVGRWPKRKRNSVRIPAKRYKSSNVVGSSSSKFSQENVNDATIKQYLHLQDSIFVSNNTRPSIANPNSVSSGSSSSSSVKVHADANISRSSSSSQALVFPAMPKHDQQLYDTSSMVDLLDEYSKRIENVEQRLYNLKQNPLFSPMSPDSLVPVPPNPFLRPRSPKFASGPIPPATLSNISNPSSSSVQSQSNATMPSYHHPSSSSVSLPQDPLPNSSPAAEIRTYGWGRQLPLLRIGVDLNFPPPDDNDDEDEDGGRLRMTDEPK